MNVSEQILRGESDVKIARDMAKEELDRCNRYGDYAEYQALKNRYCKLVFEYFEQSHRGVAQ